ncbi:hypothetical protein V5799_025468 [Amblyomma americanum]|uniref:Uncharacterized protein n=1 Tax=Amblyomma americanum TaxID=6943 RepID=A0AAQ4E963_AMBAM
MLLRSSECPSARRLQILGRSPDPPRNFCFCELCEGFGKELHANQYRILPGTLSPRGPPRTIASWNTP